jgi:hypothetical protein
MPRSVIQISLSLTFAQRNATGLIEEYWRLYRKENKGARKPSASKPKPVAKQPRKSVPRDGGSIDGSPARKRIRTGKDKEPSGLEASDAEEEARKVKKQRKSNGTTTSKMATTTKRVTKTPEAEDGDPDVGKMDKEHDTVPAWDHLIQKVETVERSGGVLFVYFILSVPSPFCILQLTGSTEKRASESRNHPHVALKSSRGRYGVCIDAQC